MINEQGGINGRTINLISLDDAYSPPKTVEQVRRLVEQEQVAFLFNTLGTAPNAAIRQYLNDNKVPQLFVATGAAMFSDPQHFPWTMGWQPNYQTEAKIFGKHILQTKPDGKIGVLYQNDSFGKDYLIGLKAGLGEDHAGMVIKEVSYETSEPTVDSQIVTLQGSGADVLLIAATPKFAAQAIRKTVDIGWTPVRYMTDVSQSIATVMKPAGLDKSKGVITAVYGKDPTDARWKDTPGFKEYSAFIAKYMSPNDLIDSNAVYGFGTGATMVQVLKQCGNDLSRENVMKQAANLKDLELPMTAAGHQDQHLARQFQPNPARGARQVQRRKLGAVFRDSPGLKRHGAARSLPRGASPNPLGWRKRVRTRGCAGREQGIVSREQGIFSARAGNCFAGAGNFFGARAYPKAER